MSNYKKLFVGLAVVAMVFFVASPAQAVTIEELNAQITELMQQIAALSGQVGTPAAGGVPTPPLTVGNKSPEVEKLQRILVSSGHLIMPPGVAFGYFGPLTQAALASWQTANGVSPAVGYYGSISQGRMLALGLGGTVVMPPVMPPMGYPAGCTSWSGFSTTTGMPCSGGSNLPAGCMSSMGFSPTTGVKCDGSTTPGGSDNSGPLTGGAGSIEDIDFLSGIQNEKVGEDEEDVVVSTVQIDADDGSDIELTAVRLDFDASTGVSGVDFEKYASEVSIWLDGEELARVDADQFNDDNNYDRTVSLDSGGIIKAGVENAELTVKVSGISNLDSSDAGDTWTLIIENVRFVDAQGASVTDSSTGAVGTETRTFTFETFATAVNAELKIKENDTDINTAHVIDVHASDDTNDIAVLSFTLEAEGDSDLQVEKMSASTTVTTATNVDDLVKEITLWLDGEEIASGECSSNFGGADADCATVGAAEGYLFNDLNYTIAAGDTVEGEIRVSFHSVADALNEGDSVSVSITESSTDDSNGWLIKDETGEKLVDADITGTVNSGVESHVVYDVGIQAKFVSASATDDQSHTFSGGDDTGIYQIVFDVTAFGNDVSIDADLIASSTADTMVASAIDGNSGIYWATTTNSTATTTSATGNPLAILECAGTATGGIADVTTAASLSFGIAQDTTRRCTLSVNIGPVTGDVQDGIRLRGISWDTESGDVHDTLYNFDMGDYKTNTISLLNT